MPQTAPESNLKAVSARGRWYHASLRIFALPPYAYNGQEFLSRHPYGLWYFGAFLFVLIIVAIILGRR